MGEDWLKIAAFNVQIFGASKIEKHNVTAILTKILLRYDLIFFQEIRDTSGEAIVTLMEKLNNASAVPGGETPPDLSAVAVATSCMLLWKWE